MKNTKSKLIISSALLALGLSHAQATIVSFSGNSDTSGALGNTRAFSQDGIAVTASAQSFVGAAWEASYLGIYSYGLGVTNSLEGSGGSGTHTVDNLGSIDRVVFSFLAPVILDSVGLSAFGDTDITAYYFSGGSWNILENNYGNAVNRIADINAGEVSALLWAVGALNPANGSPDSFKINCISFNQPTPPPPSVPDSGGSLVLLAIGAGCLAWAKSRTAVVSSISRG